MLIKDLLKKPNGSMIEYAVVNGNAVSIKNARISINRNHRNFIYLYPHDKLGRSITPSYIPIDIDRHGDNSYYKYCVGYWKTKSVRLYVSKEDAYNYVIEKLRRKRQEINKKMLKIQMEAFGKRVKNV